MLIAMLTSAMESLLIIFMDMPLRSLLHILLDVLELEVFQASHKSVLLIPEYASLNKIKVISYNQCLMVIQPKNWVQEYLLQYFHC